ncbi:MAG: glycosyltransferase family 4 protein [Gemmatimonadetes bacterium]|nr:glycosyltransferase family 4 protein [Gemmatimonadota bacterium]
MADQESEPTTVCLVAPSMAGFGGQSVMADRLATDLAARGRVRVDFVSIDQPIHGSWSRLQRIKYVRTLVTSLRYVLALVRRMPRADVVHVFSASYWSFILAPTPAILLGRLLRKPVILHYHSGEAEDHLARSLVATRLIKLARFVAVPSPFLASVFERHGIGAVVIPNHLEPGEFSYRERRDPPVTVLSNRNLEALYNVGGLLEVFRRIQDAFPDTRLIVAGSGSQEASLRQQARDLGLTGVRFTGSVEPAQMVELLHDADLYVNASLIDNMPMSILEAFASGLPVVSSDAGGIPFIVKDGVNGLLAKAGDVEELAAQALRIFEDPELGLTLADQARQDCLDRYAAEPALREWEGRYAEAAGPSRRRVPTDVAGSGSFTEERA